MTREQVNNTLRYLERLREDSYEADAKAEKQMVREYGRIWRTIEPYVSGKVPYTQPESSTQ